MKSLNSIFAFAFCFLALLVCQAQEEVLVKINGEAITQKDLMEVLEKSYDKDEIESLQPALVRFHLQEMIIFKIIDQNTENVSVKCLPKDYIEDVERYEKPFLAYYLRWGLESTFLFVQKLQEIIASSPTLKKKHQKWLEECQERMLKTEDQKTLVDIWQEITNEKEVKGALRKVVFEKYRVDFQIFRNRIRTITKFRKHVAQKYNQKDFQEFAQKEEFALCDGLIRMSHIFLAVKSKDPKKPITPQEEDAVKQKALELSKEIQKDLSNFAQAAQKHTQDQSTKYQGGDLGWIPRWTASTIFGGFLKHIGWTPHPSETYQDVVDQAYHLKENTLSQPIRSSWGYHIVVVTARKEGTKLNKDELIKRSEDMLCLLEMERLVREWIKKSKIEWQKLDKEEQYD
ncbi:MAG: peptidylprolyl isomerase [Candidatus Brocadiae bacterium]|nr:peptidylprolyl isomerase [Candidatus Brocadiia bacterium]